ncbi:hypothetical protein P691DRAFT_738192 [Macrolepiota fuliginosa MF-IS2]|uniref:NACHT domain-containing protein n=1 Tax=Macrolepiota fuliginosa MF-IS2 TaxID=1400762 RepID=A0A9P5X2L8_9AGAR|nr:hypothetical protein P691DRAFT_738192 [Macrolepiota fuliginosa MF-IS2]
MISHRAVHFELANTGLKILLKASIPYATYDSSERPLHCHSVSHYRYVDQIVRWGTPDDVDRQHRIFWLKGPANVGKSAIAQYCAEELASQRKLVAAFFFSRSSQRDDARRLFASIAYQWALKHRPYAEILESTIHNDPTIVDKDLPYQFQHLFVLPLRKLIAKGENIPERVVIIDGLDECTGEIAQQFIIEIIAASVLGRSTPFVWIFCSRPELHLIMSFDSPEVSPITCQKELLASQAIDNGIVKYLTDELAKIGRDHGLLLPWPRVRDIYSLVGLSAGLYIYADTAIRFIGDRNSLGPEDQLQAVLALAADSTGPHSESPLSELDSFYLLIVRLIPAKVLQTIQWILLATTIPHVRDTPERVRRLPGLSTLQFDTACRSLHSVMKVEGDLERSKIIFHHPSFMDFMQDPKRSKQFCIRSESVLTLRTDLVQRLKAVLDDPDVVPYTEPFRILIRADRDSLDAYKNIVIAFLYLCSTFPLDEATLAALASLNFRRMAELGPRNFSLNILHSKDILFPLKMHKLFLHVPEDHRSKIIQSCKDKNRGTYAWELTQMPYGADWSKSYILGHSKQKCFCWYDPRIGQFDLRPYPEPPIVERPTPKKTRSTFTQRIKFWKT